MALIVNKTERVKINYTNGVITLTGKGIRGSIRISPEAFRDIYFSKEDYATVDIEVSN